MAHPLADQIEAKARVAFEKSPVPDIALILSLSGIIKSQPDRAPGLRRTSQWKYDQKENTLTRVEALTKVGAPAVVFEQSKRDS